MSTADRALARLPLKLFEFDQSRRQGSLTTKGPKELRELICGKLKYFWKDGGFNGSRVQASVKTVGPLLELPAPTLVRVLDPLLTFVECQELRRRICEECSPRAVTALDLMHQRARVGLHIPTGLSGLDNVLKGGLRKGTVTEVVGPAGLGKTQLAIQICCEAAKLGLGSTYVDTERKLSLERLKEMAQFKYNGNAGERGTTDGAQSFYLDCDDDNGDNVPTDTPPTSGDTYKTSHQVLGNVMVHTPTNTAGIFSALQQIEEDTFARSRQAKQNKDVYPVQVLILDSIAAPALRDFDNAPQLAGTLIHIAQILKRLADQHNLAVVVVNQVTGGQQRAALGTSWHHCVSTRIQLLMERDSVRRFLVTKSNVTCQEKPKPYRIVTKGVIDD